MTTRWMRRVAAAAALLALTGCYNVHYRSSRPASDRTFDRSMNFFLWGLVGDPEINIAEVCGPSGYATLKTTDTFVDGLLATLTLGIYVPRTLVVTCARSAP